MREQRAENVTPLKWYLFPKTYPCLAPNKNIEKLKVGPNRRMAGDSNDIFIILVLQIGEELLRFSCGNYSVLYFTRHGTCTRALTALRDIDICVARGG